MQIFQLSCSVSISFANTQFFTKFALMRDNEIHKRLKFCEFSTKNVKVRNHIHTQEMQLKRVRLLLAATIAICIYETGGVTREKLPIHSHQQEFSINEVK